MQNYIFAHLSPQFYYKSIPCTYKEKHHKNTFLFQQHYMLWRKIQIPGQIFFCRLVKTALRTHPPENCIFFHLRAFYQILMFKGRFHIVRCLKQNTVFCFEERQYILEAHSKNIKAYLDKDGEIVVEKFVF